MIKLASRANFGSTGYLRQNPPAPFTAALARPGFVVLSGVAPLRVGSPLPILGRRAPVFELKEGDIGVFSLLTAEVGLEAEGEDPAAMLRAAEGALSAYPNISGEAKILRPVAFIDFLEEGPGLEEFRIVEDRRKDQSTE